jgi:hypothetical protein
MTAGSLIWAVIVTGLPAPEAMLDGAILTQSMERVVVAPEVLAEIIFEVVVIWPTSTGGVAFVTGVDVGIGS